jgi:hypothetical protein
MIFVRNKKDVDIKLIRWYDIRVVREQQIKHSKGK